MSDVLVREASLGEGDKEEQGLMVRWLSSLLAGLLLCPLPPKGLVRSPFRGVLPLARCPGLRCGVQRRGFEGLLMIS